MTDLLKMPIWQMSGEQFVKLCESMNQPKVEEPTKEEKPRRYVHGLRGIQDLFGVSHVSAQAWKNTWLKPAVIQRGRKILVDADKALELFNERKNGIR